MKTLNIALVTLALAASAVSSSFAQVITSFSDAENGGSWTLTGATITGTEGAGDLLYNATPITLDATGKTGISITASVTTAPANGFQFSLFDSTGKAATASFDWASFTSGPQTVVALFDTVTPGFAYGAVDSWNLISGGSGSAINATLISASLSPTIPEPSTYAALSGIAVLGFVAYRRRRSAA